MDSSLILSSFLGDEEVLLTLIFLHSYRLILLFSSIEEGGIFEGDFWVLAGHMAKYKKSMTIGKVKSLEKGEKFDIMKEISYVHTEK